MASFGIPDSDRMRYTLIQDEDADFLFELDQNPNVMRYINGGTPTSREDVKNIFVPRLAKYRNAEKGWGLWKTSSLENGEALGWVLIRPMDFFTDQPQWNNWELGWRFFESHWGKGLATEAAKATVAALQQAGECHKISALAYTDNHASINIMRKLGMDYIKTYLHRDNMLGDTEAVLYERDLG